MAVTIGSLLIKLGLDSGEFKSGLSQSERELKKSIRAIRRQGEELQGLGARLSVAISAPLVALGKTAVEGFLEQKKAIADVDAALTSMGDASGKTSAELAKTADALEMRSLFDAEVILKQVTAQLLTFGNVSGVQFDRAQQAALDMAQRLGGEPQAAAIQLGKALNDPIKGITALTRVGVTFTEVQKAQLAAMVEAGNVAGAQGVILAEVEREFRGAAQAAADATPWRQAQVAIGQAMDVIGEAILPVIGPVAEGIAAVAGGFASLPEPVQKVVVVAGILTATIGPLLLIIGGLVSAIATFVAAAGGWKAALAAVRAAMLALMTNPYVLGGAAVLTGIYLAWKHWDKITAIVQRLYVGVKTWLQDKLGGVFEWVKDKIRTVERAFHWMADQVVFNSHVPDMVDQIGQHMGRLQAEMVAPAVAASAAVEASFASLGSEVQGILDRLFPKLAAARKFAQEAKALTGIADPVARAGALRALRREDAGLPTEGSSSAPLSFEPEDSAPIGMMGDAIERLTDRIAGLRDKTRETTVRVAKSFKDMANDTLQALGRVSDAIKGGGFLDILGAVIGLGTQLASVGAFGKTIQTRVNSSVPGYAGGTSFHPGGLAMVGERGAELLHLPRGSKVTPHHALNRGGIAQIVPSPYFDVVVDGRVQRAAPGIASSGAQMAANGAARRRKWALG